MKDFLYRGIINSLNARFVYAVTTEVANKAILAHDCDPVSGHLLSRALNAAILSAPLLTAEERLSIQWSYDGEVRSIVADVGARADVRGFISPTDLMNVTKTEETLYGKECRISVVRSDTEKVLNSGMTKSIMRDEVEDLAYFYSFSDQVETGMLVMVGFEQDPERPVSLCQGIMIQALPDCNLEEFDAVRRNLQLIEVRGLMADRPEADNYFERVLDGILGRHVDEDDLEIHACPEPSFECHCNADHLVAVVRTLSPADRADIIAKGEDLNVTCHFCSRRHAITVEQFKALLENSGE